ncbi:MAG TPA: TetR family transcriptional regulator C-terminal domain-containing protein [Bryobacteraceae bacterium]|jgi:TetR/AcrR family transcriptional repressor of nem operon
MPPRETVASKPEAAARKTSTPTRDHLIEVGLELMRKHGYGATGLQDILKSAQIPKGSFYHHFGSKEEFTDAVLERYVTLSGNYCSKVLGNTRQAPLKRLRRYFEDLIQLAGQSSAIPGCLAGTLSLEVAAASPLLQRRLSSGFAQWQSLVASVLREAMEKGDLPKSVKPEPLAGFLLNSWEGSLLRSQADQSDAPLRDFLTYIFDEVLAENSYTRH